VTDPRTWAAPGSGTPPDDGSAQPSLSSSEPSSADRPSAEPSPADEIELETEIPLRPLGVSEILDGAVTYIRRNPRATLGMSAVLTSVVEVIVTLAQYFLIGSQARNEVTPRVLERSLGWAFLTFAGGLLLTAFVVLLLAGMLAPVMARTLLGRSTSFARTWRVVRPRLPRLVGAAAIVLAIVFLAVVIPLLPLAAAAAAGAPDGLQALAAIVGVPLALVMMVAGYVWFAFTTPILVMERRGVIASLRRSAEIVRGRWWRTFGVLFLTLVITVLAEFVVLPAPFTVVQQILLAVHPEPGGWMLVGLVALGALGRIIAGTLINPFNAAVIAILYADRRMRREAFDLELQMDPPQEDPLAAWLPGPLTAAGSGPQPQVPRGSFRWTVPAPSGTWPPSPHTPPPPYAPRPPHAPPPPPPPGWRP
jgi:hypothetical protein